MRFVVGSYAETNEAEPNDHAGQANPIAKLPIVVNGALNRGEDRDWFRFSAKKGQKIVLDLCGQQLHPYIWSLRPGWLEGLITVREITDIAPLADDLLAQQEIVRQAEAAVRRTQSQLKAARPAVKKAQQAQKSAGKNEQAKKKADQQFKAASDRLAKIQKAATEAANQRNAARKALAARQAELDRLLARPWRRLAYAHDFGGRQDPLLVFTVPRDGVYAVEVRDELYRGRAEFNYRLTVGAVPCVLAAFPSGAQRGKTTEIDLYGVNLGGTQRFALQIPSDWPAERLFVHHVPTKTGISNSIVFEAGSDPEVRENEPNHRTEEGNRISIPTVVNGIIATEGDFDSFLFHATKGQRLVFRIDASRTGSPLDARLDLYDIKGRRLKSADDVGGTFDAVIDHTFLAEGDYVIRVGDMTGFGSPRHVYRLQVHEPRPDFSLTVSPDNPRVAAGGSVALKVLVRRNEGFRGEVAISVPEPPAGAKITPTVIGVSQTEATIVVSFPRDAKPAVVPLRIVGRATIGDRPVEHGAVPAEQIRYINAWRYVPTDDMLLTVIPEVPYTLQWDQPDQKIAPGKTISVPIKVKRAAGFDTPIRVVLTGLPPRVAAPTVTIGEKESEAVVEIRAYGGAPVNVANVMATATARFKGRSFVQGSAPLRLQVTPPEKKKAPAKKNKKAK